MGTKNWAYLIEQKEVSTYFSVFLFLSSLLGRSKTLRAYPKKKIIKKTNITIAKKYIFLDLWR